MVWRGQGTEAGRSCLRFRWRWCCAPAPSSALRRPRQGGTSGTQWDSGGREYAPGELVVTYDRGEGVSPEEGLERAVPEAAGPVEVEAELSELGVQRVSLPEVKEMGSEAEREKVMADTVRRLEETPGVASVDYNYYLSYFEGPNDPLFGEQWNLRRIEASAAWRSGEGRGAKVAVVDSGVARHPDLAGKVTAERDFVDGDGRAAEGRVGHGTAVAGVLAARTDNRRGISGTCPDCRMLVAKVGGEEGPELAAAVEGIDWAVRRGAEVINLSFGGPEDYAPLRRVVDAAERRGVLVVVASGNAGGEEVGNPTVYPSAYAVGATDRADQRAPFSSYGPWLDAVAPGVEIAATLPGGAYLPVYGTSFSAPQAAGVAGLMAAEGLSDDQIRRRLSEAARDLGRPGRDNEYGAGLVDAARAVGAR